MYANGNPVTYADPSGLCVDPTSLTIRDDGSYTYTPTRGAECFYPDSSTATTPVDYTSPRRVVESEREDFEGSRTPVPVLVIPREPFGVDSTRAGECLTDLACALAAGTVAYLGTLITTAACTGGVATTVAYPVVCGGSYVASGAAVNLTIEATLEEGEDERLLCAAIIGGAGGLSASTTYLGSGPISNDLGQATASSAVRRQGGRAAAAQALVSC